MAFQRQTMENLLDKMISWAQGCSTQLTDFRVGSKIRTLYEAVAVIIEEQYDKTFRALRQLIEENLYAALSFDKIPATYSTGTVTFSRNTVADQNYYIAKNTTVLSKATEYVAPIKFYTVADAVIPVGSTSIDVEVICSIAGTDGNVSADYIVDFLQKPTGVDYVTNKKAFTNAKDEETKEAQKLRFQEFMEAQARGLLQSVEYGAKTASVVDSTTNAVIERVVQCRAIEDLPARKGEVDLYVWNGVGAISATLKASIQKILVGYYNDAGEPIYGYKSAGVIVNIYSAPTKVVLLKLQVTPETWTTLDSALKATIANEINRYFAALKLGSTLVQTALEANIKGIAGVYDVKLYLSTDGGATWSTDNIDVEDIQIAVASTITYV